MCQAPKLAKESRSCLRHSILAMEKPQAFFIIEKSAALLAEAAEIKES